MKSLLTIVLFFLLSVSSFGQKEIKLVPTDFNKNGQAHLSGEACYQLTSAINWTSGSIWYKKPINLAQTFEMELDCFFGCEDWEGADGIVFVFTSQKPKTGFQGEGMGFGGLPTSLGIEMDTYQNPHLSDPEYDHIALMANGNLHHAHNLTKVKPLSAQSNNIEDCTQHRLKVSWNPKTEMLKVFFDDSARISYEKDIVQSIFKGNPLVYWGFTSATGGKNNRHQVCFEKVVFEPINAALSFDEEMTKQLLKGEIKALEKLQYQTGKHTILPSSYPELDKLYALLKSNPKLSLQIFGHTDSAGSATANLNLSQKRANTIADYLIKKGIAKDRIMAKGHGEKFPIADNNTSQGRAKNRRIEVMLVRAIP